MGEVISKFVDWFSYQDTQIYGSCQVSWDIMILMLSLAIVLLISTHSPFATKFAHLNYTVSVSMFAVLLCDKAAKVIHDDTVASMY